MTSLNTPSWHRDDFREPGAYAGPQYLELELRGKIARPMGPKVAKIIGGAALFVVAGWAALTSLYILLHDDLLATAIQERRHLRAGYEEQIAGLRGEINVISGQLMLNEDVFDEKVDRIRQRQALLEARQAQITALVNDPRQMRAANIFDLASGDVTGSVTTMGTTASAAGAQGGPLGSGIIRLAFTANNNVPTVSRLPFSTLGETGLPQNPENRADADLSRLAQNQNLMEAEQFATLSEMEESAERVIEIITGALTQIGSSPNVALARLTSVASADDETEFATPVRVSPQPIAAVSSFDLQIERIRARLTQANDLYRALSFYPLRRPLPPTQAISSRYGSRLDPFHRRPAFHAGLDFRARRGVPVQATALGRVTKAGRQGGYGKMVEISHGDGVRTRYAHLSSINVRVGQSVQAGDIVGAVGSTGRSTGPHLHYEIRRNGRTVDPLRFVRAGSDLIVD